MANFRLGYRCHRCPTQKFAPCQNSETQKNDPQSNEEDEQDEAQAEADEQEFPNIVEADRCSNLQKFDMPLGDRADEKQEPKGMGTGASNHTHSTGTEHIQSSYVIIHIIYIIYHIVEMECISFFCGHF